MYAQFTAFEKSSARLSVFLYTRFDVVARKESSVAVHNTFPPSVVVLFNDVDYGSFIERKLVIFVLLVTVDRNDCNNTTRVNNLILGSH